MDEPQAQSVRRDEKPHISDTGISWMLIIFVLIMLAFAVTVFGAREPVEQVLAGTPTPTTTERPSRTYTVSFKAGVFSPTNLRIRSGDTVRFRNDGILSIRIISDPHPTHDALPGFDSVGDIPPGGAFSYTFALKGTFGYHNEKNPEEAGTIIVRE